MESDSVRYETEQGRKYKYPGKAYGYPGVTSIIKAGWPSEYLEIWKTGNIAKNMIAHSKEMRKRLKRIEAKPDRMKELSAAGLKQLLIDWREDTAAADRGTRIHAGVELVLTGESTSKKLKKDIAPDEYASMSSALEKLQSIDFQPSHIECPVYSHDPKFAGTADFIGSYAKTIRGKPRRVSALIDLKTGYRINKHFALQLAAYINADELMGQDGILIPMPKVAQGLVLHTGTKTPKLYKVDDLGEAYEDFLACVRIYNSANSKKGLTEL